MGIILNLLMLPGYFDVALRDLGLALGALRRTLSQKYRSSLKKGTESHSQTLSGNRVILWLRKKETPNDG